MKVSPNIPFCIVPIGEQESINRVVVRAKDGKVYECMVGVRYTWIYVRESLNVIHFSILN